MSSLSLNGIFLVCLFDIDEGSAGFSQGFLFSVLVGSISLEQGEEEKGEEKEEEEDEKEKEEEGGGVIFFANFSINSC